VKDNSNPGSGNASVGSQLGVDPKLLAKLAGSAAPGQAGPGGASGAAGTAPGENRVRIDPAQLASDDEDPERPPAPPTGLRLPGQGSGDQGTPPLGGVGHPTSGSGAQGGAGVGMPSLGGGSPSASQPGKLPDRPRRSSSPPVNPRSIQVPLDLVVACGPDGVELHPGGYRLSLTALKRDKRLKRDLVTIVQNYTLIDPMIHPRPRIKFLVEPGGGETYAEARRQTILSDLAWPVTLQVAGIPAPQVFAKERF
jgi:hypothetical protein